MDRREGRKGGQRERGRKQGKRKEGRKKRRKKGRKKERKEGKKGRKEKRNPLHCLVLLEARSQRQNYAVWTTDAHAGSNS